MGRRGPGAKPRQEQDASAFVDLDDVPDWRDEGISRAEAVCRFIESLPVTAGVLAGERIRLRDWQRAMIEAVYSTDAEGKRQIRTALWTMPRKNGKTGLAAPLALAHLCGPEAESRGQVYSAAADREQAAIIFREMVAMIERHPELSARINVKQFSKELEDDETGSTYKALSSDARTKHGLSASFVVFDELAQSPNRTLYDVLATSTAARAEPLMVVISTQSPDPNHVMSELVDYGRQINEGTVEDSTFQATIYSAPLDSDWLDEDVWHACNPALGDFRSLDEMRTAARQAERIPARESTFRALYLNQPVDADDRFISPADWDSCKGPVEAEALRGRPCWAGLDLSATRDLTALVLYFPHDNGAIVPYFWAPDERLDLREESDRVPYRTWQRKGLIEATPGRAVDKRAIALRLADIAGQYDLQAVAFDRWGMDELQRILAEEGIDLPLVEYGQGFKDMAPAVSALETAVLSHELEHDGNPVLAWCLDNVSLDVDPAGNRKMTKSKSRDRIDGAVAMAQAVGIYSKEQPAIAYDFDRELVIG